MRVLHINNNLERGGAERLILDMLPLMQSKDVDVTLYLLALRDETLYKELVAKGIRVIVSSASSLYSPSHISAIRKIVREESIQVVHAHLFPSMFWATCALLGSPRIQLVATEHNTWNRRRRPWFWPVDFFLYHRYQRIACISHQTAAALIKWMPSTSRKVCVVENGIDLARFTSATPGTPGPGRLPIVISVGRMTPQKAFDVLIRAAASVPGAMFWLVGDGPLRNDLQALVTSLGLNDRIELLGNRADVPELLQQATLYVQPSQWEGFGIAAVEAMSTGLPIIASAVAGLREVVGEAGILFPAGSEQELARNINQLLADSEQRQALGALGRIRASRFAIARTVDAYLSIYEEVSFSQTTEPVEARRKTHQN